MKSFEIIDETALESALHRARTHSPDEIKSRKIRPLLGRVAKSRFTIDL